MERSRRNKPRVLGGRPVPTYFICVFVENIIQRVEFIAAGFPDRPNPQ